MGASDDLVASFRLAVTDERRLFGAGLLAVLAWGLWVAATGAALTFLADAVGLGLSPEPWTGGFTAVVAVALLLWVVLPSALAVRLLADRLTNHSDNLAQHYRYRHPGALLAPPIALLAVAAGAVAALDPPWPAYPVLAFGALFLLVRTLAYSYRVFALSAPRVVLAAVGLTAPLLAVALITGGAIAAGRGPFLTAVADGFGRAVGVGGLGRVLTAPVTVAGVAMPTVLVAAVAVPVGLSAAYLAGQTAASLAARIREPTVRRSALRTGQRYPAFAQPAAGRDGGTAAGDGSGSDDPSGADGPADTAGGAGNSNTVGTGADPDPRDGSASAADEPAAGGDPGEGAAMAENVSNTRVYSPPEGFDADGGADGGSDAAGDTAVASGNCPACGGTHDGSVSFCPDCGEPL
jgi:hypothetical protein